MARPDLTEQTDPAVTRALPGAGVGPAPPLRPPAHRVDRRAVHLWRLEAAITFAVVVGGQLVALALGAPPAVLPWTAAATGLVLLAYALVAPVVRYRVHRWEVTDEAVYTRSGVLTVEWRIAPLSRIQTVDTRRGPLQRLFSLATVTVTTASARGPVRVEGLDEELADHLARRLTATTQATPGDAT